MRFVLLIITALAIAVPQPSSAVSVFGATNGDTSEVMVGRVAVGIVWVSAPGAEWESGAENRKEKLRIRKLFREAFAWWEDQAAQRGVPLEFALRRPDYEANVEVDPLQWSRRRGVRKWGPQAIASMGERFEGNGVLRAGEMLANELRREMEAHWGFFVFILKGEKFDDDRNHFVYRHGGPFITLLAGRTGGTSVKHEIGHIFYAMDEYYEAGLDCDDRAGYFATPHSNTEEIEWLACSDADPEMRCDESEIGPHANSCGYVVRKDMMRRSRGSNVREGLVGPMMAQLGWLTDAWGRLKFYATQPELLHWNVAGGLLSGLAADRPTPNKQKKSRPVSKLGYWTGLHHDIGFNAIVDISIGRIGDPGWVSLAPLDGLADRPLEAFQWLLPDDLDRNPFVQIRLTNQGGQRTIRTLRLKPPAPETAPEP